jgi:hypothetical protein
VFVEPLLPQARGSSFSWFTEHRHAQPPVIALHPQLAVPRHVCAVCVLRARPSQVNPAPALSPPATRDAVQIPIRRREAVGRGRVASGPFLAVRRRRGDARLWRRRTWKRACSLIWAVRMSMPRDRVPGRARTGLHRALSCSRIFNRREARRGERQRNQMADPTKRSASPILARPDLNDNPPAAIVGPRGADLQRCPLEPAR